MIASENTSHVEYFIQNTQISEDKQKRLKSAVTGNQTGHQLEFTETNFENT